MAMKKHIRRAIVVVFAMTISAFGQSDTRPNITMKLVSTDLCFRARNEVTVVLKNVGTQPVMIDIDAIGRISSYRSQRSKSWVTFGEFDGWNRTSNYVRLDSGQRRTFRTIADFSGGELLPGRYAFRLGYFPKEKESDLDGIRVIQSVFDSDPKWIRVRKCG